VIQKVFINIVHDAKWSCSNFFLPFSLCLCFLCFFGLLLVFDFVATIEVFAHAHSWTYGKVSNIQFDGCYGHLLSAILVSRRCWR
jgi:hypothetical protein